MWQDHQREIQGTWPIILGKTCINEADEVIDDRGSWKVGREGTKFDKDDFQMHVELWFKTLSHVYVMLGKPSNKKKKKM